MQTGLICFEIIARLNKVNVDLRTVIREYGITEEELSKEMVLRIAKKFGFKAKLKNIPIEKLSKYPMPAIFITNEGTYGVLLKANFDDKKALIFTPQQQQSQELTFEEIEKISQNEFIIFAHNLISSDAKFGFIWFFNEILKYKMVIAEVLTGSFIVQLFGLVTPLFTQVIIDKVVNNRAMTTLDTMGFAFIAVALFEFILNTTRNYIFIHTANKIDAKLGTKLFKNLFALPLNYFESRQVGNIIARVRELDSIREFICNKSVSLIIDVFFSLVFVAVMFLYSAKLTFIVLGFISIIGLLYVILTPQLRERLNNKFKMSAQSNSYLVEAVTGVQTVKSLAIEGSMLKKWEDYLGKYLTASFNLAIMGTFSNAICGFLQKLMTIVVLYLGVKLVLENKLSLGQLIAFNMYTSQFTGPVLRLVNMWNEFQQTLLGIDRLGDILNHPIEVQSENAITLPRLNGVVKFANIGFKYSPNAPEVLKNLSFNIPAGASVGLVGRSGSGKSTITKLIQRLYIPHEGAILIDDIDLRHVNPTWLRYNIGVVLQENFLFSGTISENIRLPRPEASTEMVIEVAKLAGAHEFISEFPEGYETHVGERGSSLSGGQRQRIAIARALITNPRIIIFDEATSALDYESEKIIQKNINAIKKGRTMFFIAHRLSTVRDCDIIIALDKGKIIEMGSYYELLDRKGYFYHLNKQQEADIEHQ